jgi:hypothetical protein
MKQASVAVATELPVENVRYLPITHLTLTNFAVDAGPFVSHLTHPLISPSH